jgi:hypothetical protein
MLALEDVDCRLISKVGILLPPCKLSCIKIKLWIDVHLNLLSQTTNSIPNLVQSEKKNRLYYTIYYTNIFIIP